MSREVMHYDVVIVGGGPAGLAAAIRLKQLASEQEISVCLIEKGSEIGAHILSGAVMDPRALNELLPNWKALNAPLNTPVTEDRFLFLSEKKSFKLPSAFLPPTLKNYGNYIVSLGEVCRWLGKQAENLGVEIYAGFAGTEILYNEQGAVTGIATGDMGIDKNGNKTDRYQPGIELHAKYTFFAEGCRGHLGKQLEQRFALRQDVDPQVYGIGLKELWQVKPEQHQPGLVLHTAGWPLDNATYGGSFLYHLDNHQVAVGFVIGLNYTNPYLNPFEEFQRFKTHPAIRSFFEGGKRISYGARAISAGGLPSLPKLIFPGGCLLGDDAGFLNAARIKGSHAAIKSGMLAAEAVVAALQAERQHDELHSYPEKFKSSWLYQELYSARNFKPAMSLGLRLGSLIVGIEQLLFRGRAPWTLHHKQADHKQLEITEKHQPLPYPKPDGVLTFDRLSSVFISNTNHEENQPCHLQLKDAAIPIKVNLALYDAPEQRYCPAGVYEIVHEDNQGRFLTPTSNSSPFQGEENVVSRAKRDLQAKKAHLEIHAQNCVHCKTCDIKDPTQNINWVAPEGGGGPNYQNM